MSPCLPPPYKGPHRMTNNVKTVSTGLLYTEKTPFSTPWHKFYLLRCSGHCSIISTFEECLYCQELAGVRDKWCNICNEPRFITTHPGFEAVASNIWNLQALYYFYRQHYGTMRGYTIQEWYHIQIIGILSVGAGVLLVATKSFYHHVL